jgi:hypothetical protein
MLFVSSPDPRPFFLYSLSIRIMMLGENSRKILGFKGLIRKIFRNKDLACQRALKMVLGQLRGASFADGHISKLPQSGFYYRIWWVISQSISVVDEMR